MPHAENIEELLTRRPGGVSERYRSELEEAYRREGRTESFENFRDGGSTEWSLWRDNQVAMLRADDVLRLDDMRFRLKLVADLNSPPADFPPPGNPMFGERLAAFGGGAISEEFTKKAGIPSDESLAARWGRLIEQARLDVQRRSTDLASVWNEVRVAADAELHKKDALVANEDDATTRPAIVQEGHDLIYAMQDFSKSLEIWERAIKEKPYPSIDELSRANISSFGPPQTIIAKVTSLFPHLDGAEAPVATYKVVATVQAIGEMLARQARARLPPHTFTRMFDLLTEVPGRAEPETTIAGVFRDDYKRPGKVWDQLMTLARERPRDDPALEARFKRFMSEDQGSGTPAPQGARIRNIKKALNDWGNKKLTSPADEKSFKALASVAFDFTGLREEISKTFSGPSDSERRTRKDLEGAIDGALARLRNEIVAYKGS